ncbi:hypothetical protein P8891_06145 [Bacillus atrophaeus]|uniref:hypothetical protein n=1 Tax=Bacillus atrophaeus TaxID=1452 RepID=UPI00227ECDA6|nr:hypothetical protein [Bacillus atrophaeus]MCY7948040.1 hypothetical protein [Bacillus atrophaeus]MCY8098015.1 hypothetical protein [Bacillus atrophaeus]MCY9169939.1 hypothetical protein [Bacillus atrophaeus]MEC0740664.1 hypothetical protein [Bacillus atrophaeus]MEC0747072.1 hypothetical protein [Bacillus atrophaeus]
MKYNKKNQGFTELGRFHLYENGEEVQYCRIKFLRTKHVQIVKGALVDNGEFEDQSLIKEGHTKTQEDVKDKEISEASVLFTAINQDGQEVAVEDLEDFCALNDLDEEAVKACLNGEQKTHKKWSFKTA